jgi:hypothetical protein
VNGVNRGIEALARDRGATWIDLQPMFDQGDGAMACASPRTRSIRTRKETDAGPSSWLRT